MKRIGFISLLVALLMNLSTEGREYKVFGPQGGLAMDVTLPDGFDTMRDHCPMVILMHGIFSSKDFTPMPQIAKALAKRGIASIRFDFGGHWKSQGKMINMTVPKELEDARAMWDYAEALPYVSSISLLGHSQGGVIASMAAGQLAAEGKKPASLVLLAPGAVIKEACQSGHFFGNVFDPADPPKYVKCFGMFKLGREYMLTSQNLEIYETAAAFQGPVCIIHGDSDDTVPLWCSEKYEQIYANSEFHLVAGENHRLTKHTDEVVELVVDFFCRNTGAQKLNGKKFIFCANSMVYYGGCVQKGDAGKADEGMFYKLLKANGVEDVTVVDNTFGGHRLQDYLEEGCRMENGGGSGCPGEGVDLLAGLDLASFDYVIISEAGNNFEEFYNYAERLYRRFTSVNPDAKLVYINHVYSVYKNHNHVLQNLQRLHDELGVTIVNCGQLAYDIYTGAVKVPGGNLTYSDRYTFCNHKAKDTYHPNPLMGYIMTQMLYCALTGESAEGFDYEPMLKGCYYADGSVSYDEYFEKYYPESVALPFTTVLGDRGEMSGIQKLIPNYIDKF